MNSSCIVCVNLDFHACRISLRSVIAETLLLATGRFLAPPPQAKFLLDLLDGFGFTAAASHPSNPVHNS
jgi:hypothetical protein